MKQIIALIRSQNGAEHILDHGTRVAELVYKLVRKTKLDVDIVSLLLAAEYHDVGKVFVPKSILNKPSKLQKYEFDIIKMHTIYGCKILEINGLQENTQQIVLNHHENFDGTGYPNKFKGEEIPIGARIIKICDTYDALTSDRPYRSKLTVQEAIEIMDAEQNKYDPDLYITFKEFVLKLSTNLERKIV